MLKKYLTKFTIDILPSVAATVIGAYIVNHYIVTRPGTDAPVAAAVSAADPKSAAAKPTDGKTTEAGNLPAAGVKAKGISEKAMLEKTAAERPAVVEKVEAKADLKADVKADAKPADAPAETASVPAEPRPYAPRTARKGKDQGGVAVAGAGRDTHGRGRAAVCARCCAGGRNRCLCRMTAATPTTSRALRSIGCVSTMMVRRVRPKWRVPDRRDSADRDASDRDARGVAAAPTLRPLPPPITVSTPSGAETLITAGRLMQPMRLPIRAVRRRRPKSRFRVRSICGPMW